MEGVVFLDAYAGTGAIGIEALSRGARRVVFLEKHRASVMLIRKNLASLEISEGVEVLPVDVCRGLAKLAERGAAADILFFDPPYAETEAPSRVLDALAASPLAGPHSLVIFERARKARLPNALGPFSRVRTVEQGDAALDFYSRMSG
jgi:16S rRNA (guanine(966)-N(2))-methyltransferase RsmD